jgi:hypothetical protein
LRTRSRTRSCANSCRQRGLLCGRERLENRVEVDHRLGPVARAAGTESERAAHLRGLGAKFVGLTVLVDLLACFGILPPAQSILDAVVGRGGFGEVRRDPAEAVPTAALDVLDARDRLELLERTRAPSRESGFALGRTFRVQRRPLASSIRIFDPGNR